MDGSVAAEEAFRMGYARVVGSADDDGPVFRCFLTPEELIARPLPPAGGRRIENIYDM
jgi:hypothetical protein